MPFPALRPSSRSYDLGDWPVRTYKAQSGAEIRLLFGNKRSNFKLALSYNNVSDSNASEFALHFEETKGTYSVFSLSPSAKTAILAGWNGAPNKIDTPAGVDWRYEKAPQITAVRPGISTVTVNLIGVI